GGAGGMSGAALHAARAALAAGAGLVKLVAARETIAAAQASLPDLLTVESSLGENLEPAVAEAVEWADAVVLGPGLGRVDVREGFVAQVLARRAVPTVIDADALHYFKGQANRPVVCTAHTRWGGPRSRAPGSGPHAACGPPTCWPRCPR